MGSLLGYLTAGEEMFSSCASGTVVPQLTSAASIPWHPSRAGAGMLHTKSFSDSEIWRVLNTIDVENVTQGHGGGGGEPF